METAEKLRAFTQDLYLRLSFPAPAAALLQEELEKLLTPADFPAFYAILDQYQDDGGKYPNMEMLLQMQALCRKVDIPDFTGALLLLSCMCLRLKERYQRNGMPEQLFYHTMSDLRYKLTECVEVYGLVGNFVPWWYYGFFDCSRVALGRLQFELRPLEVACRYQGRSLTPETVCINIHIPKTGTRLDHTEVLEAYRMAREYFRPQLGDGPVLFLCKSWLLDPWLLEVLPEGSNMRAFARDFHIVEVGEDKNYEDLWRVFNRPFTGDIDALPADTALRRAFLGKLRRGEPAHWGRGIFQMD